MQLAGVVGMGKPQEGLRPELLKYFFVKGQEASEQQPGNTTFWVFNQSHGIEIAGTASTERHEQFVEAVPEVTAPEASAVKQTAITDFFSPRSSTPLTSITPCHSVTLAEVPAVFVKQSNIVDGDNVFDPTHPLFEDWKPPSSSTKTSPNTVRPKQSNMDTDRIIQHLEASMKYFRRKQRDNSPMSPNMSANGSGSDASHDGTLLGSAAQRSESSSPASPICTKENVASKNASSSSELANTEAAHKSEIECMRLVHEQEMKEMKEKLDEKVGLAKLATDFAAAATAKLAANLAKQTDVRTDSVAVSQLTKRRDNLLKELESSRDKITDLTRRVQETKGELATAVMRIDDTRAALAAANVETVAARAETDKANEAVSALLSKGETARLKLKARGDLIEKLLNGKENEVIKEQIRLTTFLRAENEDYEQQLHAASLENTSLRKDAKDAVDDAVKNRRLMSSYKKELQSCNAKILELEGTLEADSDSLSAPDLLRDRDQALAELSDRVKEVAFLRQLETKYENHVIELHTDLHCMYRETNGLEQELRKMEQEFERVNRANDRLQQKVTLFESNTLLVSRWNSICNKHAILNLLMTEKLTLEKDRASLEKENATLKKDCASLEKKNATLEKNCASLEKENAKLEKDCASLEKKNATLEERHIRFERSIQDFKSLVHDLLHRMIRLSRALESRGAYPFNRGYTDILDRILLVADLEAEHVYGDATTNFSEHEFDIEESDPSDDEDSYDEEGEGDEDEEHKEGLGDGDNNNVDDSGGRTDGGNQNDNRWAGGKHKAPVMPNDGCEDNNGGSQDYENADMSNGGKDVASTSSSGPSPNAVSSAPISLAEEVEKSITVAADLEEVLKSPKVSNAKSTRPRKDGADVGKSFDSGSGKNPTPKPTAEPKIKSGEGAMSPESRRIQKMNGATTPLTAGKGDNQDIWKGTPFGTAGNEPSSLKAAPATDLKAGSNGTSPIFKSFSTPESAGDNTPTLENLEAKPGNEATKVQKEAATSMAEKAFSSSQPQGFNFGGSSGPVSFTASSSFFPARVNQPATTGMFSSKEQTSASVTIQPKEKAAEDSVAKDENLEEKMPKTGPSKEKAPGEAMSSRGETPEGETLGEEMPEVGAPEDGSPQQEKLRKELLKEESAPPEEETSKGAPAPSASGLPLSRNQKRAAKEKQKKAARKAGKEAMNARS